MAPKDLTTPPARAELMIAGLLQQAENRPSGEQGVIDLRSLRHVPVGDKFGNPGFSAAIFYNDYRRNAEIVGRTGLVFDVEFLNKFTTIPPTPSEFADRLRARGLGGVLWTTYHHTPEKPRYRVAMNMAGCVLPDGKDFDRDVDIEMMQAIAHDLELDVVVDVTKFAAESFFFLPSAPPEGIDDAELIVVEGACYNPAAALAEAQKLVEARREALAEAQKRRAGAKSDNQLATGLRHRIRPLREVLEVMGYTPTSDPDRWLSPYSKSGKPGCVILEGEDGVERVAIHHADDPLNLEKPVFGVRAHDVVDFVVLKHFGPDADMGKALGSLLSDLPAWAAAPAPVDMDALRRLVAAQEAPPAPAGASPPQDVLDDEEELDGLPEDIVTDLAFRALMKPGETPRAAVERLGRLAEAMEVDDVFSDDAGGPPPPDGVLPRFVERIALVAEDSGGIDPSLTALPILQAMSTTPKAGTIIEAPMGALTLRRPPNLFAATVAPPSSGKSFAIEDVAEPAHEAVAADLRRLWLQRRKQAQSEAKRMGLEGAKAADYVAENAPGPVVVQISGMTIEGVRDTLAAPGQADVTPDIMSDELASILVSLRAYSSDSTAQKDILQGIGAGGPKTFVRSGQKGKRAPEIITAPRWNFGLGGTIQIDVLRELEEKHGLLRDGFLHRFCITVGRMRRKPPRLMEGGPNGDELVARLGQVMVAVSRWRAAAYSLDGEAQALLDRVEVENQERAALLVKIGSPGKEGEIIAKGMPVIMKLTLIMHLFDWAEDWLDGADPVQRASLVAPPPPATVSVETLARAVRLHRDWLLPHLFVLTAHVGGGRDAVRRVAGWLLEQDAEGRNRFTRRDLTRSGPSVLRKSFDEIYPIVALLEVTGWLKPDAMLMTDARGRAKAWHLPRGVAERFKADLANYREALEWMDAMRRGPS